MALLKAVPLDPKFAKKATLRSQYQDGQLGWVAVGWAIGIIYEVLNYDGALNGYLKIMLLIAIVFGVAGMVISASGAIESDPGVEPPVWTLLVSLAVAIICGFAFSAAHTEVSRLDDLHSMHAQPHGGSEQ
jgi:hypothetical protein